MLSFASPQALWLCLAAIPVIVLYFLRRRFRRRPSGSNFIWSRMASGAPGARRPELRSLGLLALQLAAVLSAAIAAAGPALVEVRTPRAGLGILVDVSASMAARGPAGEDAAAASRVEAAAAAAREEIASLSGGRPVALFACAAGLEPLYLPGGGLGGDGAGAAAATRRLAATAEGFREEAVATALSAWLATRPEAWDFVLYTDGGLDLGGSRIAQAASSLRFVAIGGEAGGTGLTSLRVATEGHRGAASFSAFNGTGTALAVSLSLSLDGKTVATASLDLVPGWSDHSLALDRPPAEGGWTISAKAGGEVVGLASFALNAPATRRVLMVGKDDPYLRAALAYQGIRFSSAAGFPSPEEASGLDLVVAEGVAAPAGFKAPLLAFASLPEGAPLEARGEAEGELATVVGGHPLSRFVEWEGIQTEKALVVRPGPGVTALATIGPEAGVVAAAWSENGLARAFVGFDPARSEFGLSPAWPLFLRNLLEWASPLGEGGPGLNLEPGEVAQRIVPEGFRIEGRGAPVLRRSGRMAVIEAREAGLFRWTSGSGSGWVAVNLPAGELDLAPKVLAAPPARPAALAPLERRRVDLGGLPLLLLLASLVAEWILWRGLPGGTKHRGHDARR